MYESCRHALLGLLVASCGVSSGLPEPGLEPDAGDVSTASVDASIALPGEDGPREVVYRFLDEGDLASADKIVANVWPVNRFADVELPARLTWTENPYGEKFWRFIFYGMRPLAHVLWAYRTTGLPVYRDKLIDVVTSFVNRDHESIFIWDKHTSAYRTMMLVNIHAKLLRNGDMPAALEPRLRAEIAEHGVFLRNPANYEPGYNHGLAEAAALLLVAEAFPALPDAADWRATALDRIATLLDEAVDPDGVEVEQSPYYHFYFLTGFWDLYRWARGGGFELAPGVDERVRAMLHYAAHIVMPDGTIPLMGASLARNVRRTRDGHYDEMAALSPELDYVLSSGMRGTPPARQILFPSSGQAIIHSGTAPGGRYLDETHLVMDVGPYRTSHSDFDALALHVYAAGRPLLVDSGLFSYEAGPERTYFHGTSAHNTVIVDRKDQAEGTATAGVPLSGTGWAYQSGQHGLYEGVIHRRGVVMVRPSLVLVLDDLTSRAEHVYEQAWHLPPTATLTRAGLTATASFSNTPRLRIHQIETTGVTATSRLGSTDPIDGWYSDKYEKKVAAPALRYRQTATRARYATLLAAGQYTTTTFDSTLRVSGKVWTVRLCGPAGSRFEVRVTDLAERGESVEVIESPAACK